MTALPTTPATLLRACADGTRAEYALDGLDARVLLCHVLDWPRTALITRADDVLDSEMVKRFEALAARRQAGEPIAQLVGEREFFGRSFTVTPDVLIPRPDTELLVELALVRIDALTQGARAARATQTTHATQAVQGSASVAASAISVPIRVLDLGTGSGAIAVTLAAERPGIDMFASDQSTAALDVAARNAAALLPHQRGCIRFLHGDWFDALTPADEDIAADADAANAAAVSDKSDLSDATALFDLIVSNPPYIAVDDPHLQQGDLRFEPRGALTDEGDGLGDIRTLVQGATHWLKAGAALMIEHGYNQGAAVRSIFAETGFHDIGTERDLGGQERVTSATWSGGNDTDKASRGVEPM